MEYQKGPECIRKALLRYRECQTEEAGMELIRAVRNGIEVLSGITVRDLYEDPIAFSRLVNAANKV